MRLVHTLQAHKVLSGKRHTLAFLRTQHGLGLGGKVTTADLRKNVLTNGARKGRPRKYMSWCRGSLREGGHQGDPCAGWELGPNDLRHPFQV